MLDVYERVAADECKPHRCPRCGKIPPLAHEHGKALPGVVYRCDGCRVEWEEGA